MSKTTASTARFYDYFQTLYRISWARGSFAIHYGLWSEKTRTHKEALLNTNRVLATTAAVTPGDIVLDAGCGMGGSSLWLANQYGVKVIGITISEEQAKFAQGVASRQGITHLVSFSVQDFLETAFRDLSFTLVWAIESSCYAQSKAILAAEFYRVLKPGGRVVLADGFLAPSVAESSERAIPGTRLGRVSELDNLVSVGAFERCLTSAGFSNICFEDHTAGILPSVERVYRICALGYPFVSVLEKLGLLPTLVLHAARGGLLQREVIRAGICKYGVVFAEKPNR